jgi:hypothetical protein
VVLGDKEKELPALKTCTETEAVSDVLKFARFMELMILVPVTAETIVVEFVLVSRVP